MIHHLVAALISDGGHQHGNGRHNRNVISERSPTYNHGFQHTTNGNSGGDNPTQNALCRHVTVCHVSQRVIIVVPSRPVQAQAPVPAPKPPAEKPPEQPAVQVLPQTAVPRSPAPTRSVRPQGPFLYMGPGGSLMMGSDSTVFGIG